MIADCMAGANLVVSNYGVTGGIVQVAGVQLGLGTIQTLVIPCAGQVSVTWPSELSVSVLVALNPWQGLVEYGLLGLAGAVCAAFFCYVLLKCGL